MRFVFQLAGASAILYATFGTILFPAVLIFGCLYLIVCGYTSYQRADYETQRMIEAARRIPDHQLADDIRHIVNARTVLEPRSFGENFDNQAVAMDDERAVWPREVGGYE